MKSEEEQGPNESVNRETEPPSKTLTPAIDCLRASHSNKNTCNYKMVSYAACYHFFCRIFAASQNVDGTDFGR